MYFFFPPTLISAKITDVKMAMFSAVRDSMTRAVIAHFSGSDESGLAVSYLKAYFKAEERIV